MSLAAPYIWIMTSGIYDVLQIFDQDGSVSYFDIYANGAKVYTLEKDDDIVYVTIEDLDLNDGSTGYNICAIGYDSAGNPSEESNYVCWYDNGNYDNDGADPDIVPSFQEISSTTYFYLDGELVDTIIGSRLYSIDDYQSSALTVTAAITNPPQKVVIFPGAYIPLMYDYGTPLSAVSVTPSTIAANTSTYTISVYATSRENTYTFNRLCTNSSSAENSSVAFHHYGKTSYDDCITFISDTDDFTLTATNVEWDGTVEYSTDHASWTTWDGSAIMSASQKLYLRGYDNTTFRTTNGAQLQLSGPAGCYGNLNTLLQYDDPPTTLAEHCYQNMFYGCISLTTAPELPATTLTRDCYRNLFYGCISLTTAPELPATTLAEHCYRSLFYNCISLTTAPELPATTLAEHCYRAMFYNCISLTTAPELPATTLADYCYQYMFRGCLSLTTAPELPATTLADYCYQYMFYACVSLTTAPELPATTLADYCYGTMFLDCTSLTTAPSLPATTLAAHCYHSMFRSCTSLTTVSKLPATTLKDYCYYYMFRGCTSIKLHSAYSADGGYTSSYKVPYSGSGTAGSYSLTNMFYGTGGIFTSTPTIGKTYWLHYSCKIV